MLRETVRFDARCQTVSPPLMSPLALLARRIRPLSWSPVTESNRRPSPYHGRSSPSERMVLDRVRAGQGRKVFCPALTPVRHQPGPLSLGSSLAFRTSLPKASFRMATRVESTRNVVS
jgi:hypothetical protein